MVVGEGQKDDQTYTYHKQQGKVILELNIIYVILRIL